jgi:nucleotide-binding universal stress UspA family protein
MKKILIAIDYSPSAQNIAELGYSLGKALKVEIVLLHIIEDVEYYSSTNYDPIMGFGGFTNLTSLDKDSLQNIENEANNFLEKTKIHLNDKVIKTLVVHGKITDAILETSKNEKCDLIVLGTHSKSSFEEFFLGRTAHQLIKKSTIPLYVIPIKSIENEKR